MDDFDVFTYQLNGISRISNPPLDCLPGHGNRRPTDEEIAQYGAIVQEALQLCSSDFYFQTRNHRTRVRLERRRAASCSGPLSRAVRGVIQGLRSGLGLASADDGYLLTLTVVVDIDTTHARALNREFAPPFTATWHWLSGNHPEIKGAVALEYVRRGSCDRLADGDHDLWLTGWIPEGRERKGKGKAVN